MYKALFPWAAGIQVSNLDETIAAAGLGGFQGVEFSPKEVARLVDQHGIRYVTDKFQAAHVRPSAFSLPTEWRGEEAAWREGLENLPRLARAAAAIGCTRATMWILPGDNTREYDANYEFHVTRFTPIAHILGDAGISLGLEFLGPKTLRESFAHPFVHTLEAMLELGTAIGPNVGILLDCWHWYTAGGTVEQILALRPEQVVYVHVNDAPAGIDRDAQIDTVRALPGETGVIDIAAFLQALQQIAYNGPVTPEPFSSRLPELASDVERLRVLGAAMDQIFAQAGITPHLS